MSEERSSPDYGCSLLVVIVLLFSSCCSVESIRSDVSAIRKEVEKQSQKEGSK